MSDDHRTTPGAGGAGHISGVGFAPFDNDAPKPAMTIPEQAEKLVDDLIYAARDHEKAQSYETRYTLAELEAEREKVIAALVGVERDSPPLRAREEIAALRELYEWYDRDGSVGAAADVFEKHRVLLAQRIEHEPSERVAEPLLAEQREVKS